MAKVTVIINVVSALILLAAITSMTYGPRLHGWLFPVVSHVELISAVSTPPPDYRHTWAARATKYRDCAFQGLEWYLGPVGYGVQVPAFFTDPPQVREAGELEWHGLVIDMPEAQATSNSHAFVTHTCRVLGIPLTVRTLIFDSNGA